MTETGDREKVVLVTTSFPFGSGENFIEPEMEALPRNISLDIVPFQIPVNAFCRDIPRGVRLNTDCAVSGNRIKNVWYTLRGLFSKDFFREIKNRKRTSPGDLKRIAGYLGRTIEVAEKLEKSYKEEIRSGKIVFYSYWLLEGSQAIARLRKKYPNITKTVSRAHRVDVYDGRSVYETIPGREGTLPYLDKVYVCSEEGRNYLASKYIDYSEKFTCGYLGSQDLGWQQGDCRGDEFVIASCARITDVKRVYLLARALKNITNTRIHWIHLGDGPERNLVEDELKELPSNIKVTLRGSTPHEEVMRFYQNNHVDLFVNTSSSEGLPVSIMEAISFGIPAIATDVGGTSEIINENSGVLIPEDFDTAELANIILNYVQMEPQDYENARKTARIFWEEHFSAVKNYTEFYREITGK